MARLWPEFRAALVEALVTIVALIATVGITVLIAPDPGPAVLGAMLCITLSRSQLERDARGRVEAGLSLPVIGLLAAGVGALLLVQPVAGAIVYTLGLVLAIWLRRFGAVPRRIGSLLALPFIAILVAPAPIPRHPVGPLAGASWLIPVVVSVLAFGFVTAFQLLGRAIHLLPRPPRAAPAPGPALASGGRHLLPVDKIAIQVAITLAAAFTIGYLLFPGRWTWIVLTVVVVTLGATGRADVMYKGLSRFAGAAVGTLLALLPAARLGSPSLGAVALIIGVLFVALVLRRFAYVWWALFFTLALALLQGFTVGADGQTGGFLLGERLEEILVGAVLALAVAWFVLPLRSENTIRRRLGGVLAALQDRMTEPTPDTDRALDAALAELKKASAPYDAWLRVFRRARRPRAARWIATTRVCVARVEDDGAPPEAQRALGAARRTLREPDRLQPALDRLLASLDF